MSNRTEKLICATLLAVVGWSSEIYGAEPVVEHPFPGITYITRTKEYPAFTCFGCARPTPSPRIARMNIVLIDLTAPEIHFKFTPPGTNFGPLPVPPPNGFPAPSPPFETNRQPTLGYLNASHAQVAINSHFFAPFPSSLPDAYLIGLAASRGNVYSAFEAPFQSYAIVTDAPAVNIDSSNHASIVHRDPAFADGRHVLENVQLWNALAGSAQTVTSGVTTIPEYKDATHPDELLNPIAPYSRAGRHWYDLSNARTAIGITQDNRTLVLFTVDGTNGGHGMQGGEVADLLRTEYNVWNALNLDGGGSTTMAMEDPSTDPEQHVRHVVNSPSDVPPRAEASNLAVYSDGVPPTTAAVVSPAANARGWNNTNVTVSLDASDLASGILDTPIGWVDQVQYSLAGAQTSAPATVPGHTASFGISTPGITGVTYFATDAAGNDESPQSLIVRLDGAPPVIIGLPAGECSLWPPNHNMVQVATVSAADALSGVGSLRVTGTSNEPSDPSDPDVVVTPDGAGGFAVQLRAERSGDGGGRIYTLTATAKDLADNVKTVTTTCAVPHDRGKK